MNTEKYIISKNIESGTTATIAFLEEYALRLAWVGDTRAIVMRGPTIIAQTKDHKPDDPIEKARIEKAGGKIEVLGVARAPGGLAVSRSLGDRDVKNLTPGGVIATPQMERVIIQNNDILIIACDGLWDVASNQEVAKLVNALSANDIAALRKQYPQGRPAHEIAEEGGDERMILVSRALRDEAYRRGSTDNISVMAVQFKQGEEAAAKPVAVAAQVLNKEKVMSSLESLRSSFIDAKDKQVIETLMGMLKKGYTKTTLQIVSDQLNPLKNNKIVYFGEPATAKTLIESLQRSLDKDIAQLK